MNKIKNILTFLFIPCNALFNMIQDNNKKALDDLFQEIKSLREACKH